ncbi:MAG: M20 family metallopeptidase [Candidatus Hodarchaeales archaeon]|jgi:succinyl-diaminopimelate desuccinylase
MKFSLPILEELVSFNTENPPGNTKKIISWILKWAQSEGIASKTQMYEPDKGNVILNLGKAEKTILICGHLDTVPIGDINNWDFDPLGQISNGYFYGRGSADMKGGIAAALGAMKFLNDNYDESDFNFNIQFLGTSDEEVGLGGATASLDLKLLDSTEFLIVPEPTNLRVGIAEKGVLWLLITANGKAAHGSTPEMGVNAIEELVKLFPVLHSSVPKNIHDILGKSTLNIGVIKGGKSANVVPEQASVQCDFRLVPPFQPDEFGNTISKMVISYNKESSASFSCNINQIMPSISSPIDNPFLKEFFLLSKQNESIGLNYGTDAAVLVSNSPKPLPFVIYGPGDPKRIHISNERVNIKELYNSERTFSDFLKQFSILN